MDSALVCYIHFEYRRSCNVTIFEIFVVKLLTPSPFLDPTFGDPLRYCHQNGEVWDTAVHHAQFHTVAEVSVVRHKERDTERITIGQNTVLAVAEVSVVRHKERDTERITIGQNTLLA